MLNISQKKEQVAKLAKDFSEAEIAILVDYKGLNVSQMTELRAKLRDADASIEVVKNTLLNRAAEGTSYELLKDLFKGPNAIVLSTVDPVAPAKILVDFAKDNEKLEIRAGVLGETFIDPEAIAQLAKMPSKEELLGKLVGVLNAVPTSLVNVLSGVPRSFVNVLNAVKDQKEAA